MLTVEYYTAVKMDKDRFFFFLWSCHENTVLSRKGMCKGERKSDSQSQGHIQRNVSWDFIMMGALCAMTLGSDPFWVWRQSQVAQADLAFPT